MVVPTDEGALACLGRLAPYAVLGTTAGLLAALGTQPLSDSDGWWHLRLGASLISQHSFAAPAHWSSFATSTWAPTEPLPEVVALLDQRAFGYAGLAWLFAASLLAVLVTVFLVNRRRASPMPAALATMLTVFAASAALTSRPQLVSFVLLPVVLAAWMRTEQDLKPRWWLVPVTYLWSMCHGFWFVGVGYGLLCCLAVLLSGRRGPALRLLPVPLLSALVVTATPAGIRVFAAPFVVDARSEVILEWQRSDLLAPAPLVAEAMVAITLAMWLVARRRVPWLHVLVLLTAVFWIWYAVRTVALGGLVMSPLLASALESRIMVRGSAAPPVTRRERRSVLVAAAALLVVCAVVAPFTAATPSDVPVGLDADLDRLPAGTTIFNDYAVGGWLSWRHPGLNRYVDGLADAYPVAHLAGYLRAVDVARGWPGIVRASGASVALLRSGSALASGLERRGWTSEATADGWVLLDHGLDSAGG